MHLLFLEEVHSKTRSWLSNQVDITTVHISEVNHIESSMINAIITRGIGKINEDLLKQFPSVKVVARCGVGLDNVDTAYCQQKGISVIYAPGSNAQTTAEQTMTLLLMLQRNMINATLAVKNGNWTYRNEYKADELFGKKIGILGLGNIGHKVANMCTCFGTEISYWSRSAVTSQYTYKDLYEIASDSDIICVHLPLSESTTHLINHDFISRCRHGVLIINTARDQIIDRGALLEGLNSGKIGGYACDVPLSPYPTKDDELIRHPNTIITPHVSSLTDRTFYKMCQDTIENVVNILKTGKPLDDKCVFSY